MHRTPRDVRCSSSRWTLPPAEPFPGTTKICTDRRSARARALGFAATAAPSYSLRPSSCPNGWVSAQLGTVTRLPVHPASPILLTNNGPLRALDSVGWLSKAGTLSYLFKNSFPSSSYPEGNFGGNQLLDGIVHHLSGRDRNAHTRTLSEDQGRTGVHALLGPCFKTGRKGTPQADALRTQMPRHTVRRVLQTTIKARTGLLCSASDRDESPAPICFPPDNFKRSLTLFSKSFSSLPRGSGHDRALTLSGAPFQGTWARSNAEDASPDYNSNVKDVQFSTWALPGLWVIKRFCAGTSDYMTRIEFTTACQDAPGVLSSHFGQPRAVTHGRSASVPYPREDRGTTICDTQVDVPSARRLGAKLAFKDSMVDGILQFTPNMAFCYVVHRFESRDIHCRESFYTLHCSTASEQTPSPVHTGRPCVSVSTYMTYMAVRVCPSAHTERLWLSISTHISTLVLGLSTLVLPMDCLGDFGPRGLSVQYTQDVRGCPPAHTGLPTHKTSVAVHQYTYQHFGPWTQHAGPSRGLFGRFWPTWAVCSLHTGRPGVSISTPRTSLCVRQHTQDVCGGPCVSVSRHMTSVAVHQYTYKHVCPWTQHADPSRGLFGTSVCVRQYTQDVRGSSCVSVFVRQHTQDVRGCPSVHISARCTHRTSVGVRQHTHDVRGCPCVSVCVRLCPSVSVSTHRTYVAVHQYTYQHVGPWTQHAGPSRGLTSVAVHQHTQDVCGCLCVSVCVCGCLPTHTGRLWLSMAVRQHTQDVVCVCVCPSAHTGRSWLFISTHISTLVLGLSTLALPVECLGDVGPRRLSVQYTQDVPGCPPAHTGHMCLFVAVRQHTQDICGCSCVSLCVRVCPSAHTGRPWLSISTHISTLVLGLSTLALTVECSSDFGPRGLSVHYTQDVRGCPSAHPGRLCVFVSTHRTSVAVRVCPCVSVSTQMTSVAVHQYTYQHDGPWTQHADPSRGLFGTHISTLVVGLSTLALPVDCSDTGCPWLSISTHISTMVLGLSTLILPVAVRVFPCLSVSTHRTSVAVHQTSVGVRQHTQDIRGCPSAHTGRPWLAVCVRVCLWVSANTHRTSMAVHGCPSAHTGRPCVSVSTHWTSVCVCVCPSAHTGRSWLSISTHISTLVLGLSTLALLVDCLGDFGPRGLSVQYTQDVRGCPPAHTGRLWLSMAVRQHTQDVRGCSCVSLCVRVCPSAHTGRPWLSISTRISTLVLGLSTLALTVECSGDFGPRGLSVQYTHDVRGCPCVSMCVHVCSSVSVSTHRTSVAVCQHAHTRTLLIRSRSVSCAPVRDPANQLPCALRVYSPVDSHTYQTPCSVFQDGSNGEPTARHLEHADAKARRSGHDRTLTLSGALSRELGPGPSLRTLLQTTIRTPKTSDFQAGLFPVHSPLLRESLLVSFPRLIDMLKLSGSSRLTWGRVEDFGSSRPFGPDRLTIGRELNSPAHVKKLLASLVRILANRVRYAYDPTITEVLGMDERITTDSVGTIRNWPTESDVSRTANHPRRRDPNTSPDHSIVGATGGVYKGQGRSQRELMTRAY
ncbi:hypothetical protein YC2023_108583 [Brassica napus]